MIAAPNHSDATATAGARSTTIGADGRRPVLYAGSEARDHVLLVTGRNPGGSKLRTQAGDDGVGATTRPKPMPATTSGTTICQEWIAGP